MRIGFLSGALPYLPSAGGFRLYGANLIRRLSQRHTIDLIALLRDDDEAHLDWPSQYCASVSGIRTSPRSLPMRAANLVSSFATGRSLHWRGELHRLLEAPIAQRRWDVIHVEGGFLGSLVPAPLAVPNVLSLHDSWTLRCREMVKCSQTLQERLYYRTLEYHERRHQRLLYPRFDRCVVVANPDLREVRSTVPDARVELIPYGTDSDYFHPLGQPKEPHTLVFHSHLGYAPNIEAALEFATEIFPLVRREIPDALFHLVGANPTPKITELATRPGIRISANLPDLRPALSAAQVYVCAIRHGTGLKSKMLEAMAMQLPIVGYPGAIVGLEGSHPDVHYLLAQDPREFAAHVVTLLRDTARADQMARAGRRLVEERYSWESRARDFEALYEQVIGERSAGTGRPLSTAVESR